MGFKKETGPQLQSGRAQNLGEPFFLSRRFSGRRNKPVLGRCFVNKKTPNASCPSLVTPKKVGRLNILKPCARWNARTYILKTCVFFEFTRLGIRQPVHFHGKKTESASNFWWLLEYKGEPKTKKTRTWRLHEPLKMGT